MTQTISTAVVGGTGYTGLELIRLLLAHPYLRLNNIYSRSQAGKTLNQVAPHFFQHNTLTFVPIDIEHLKKHQLVIFATPNAVAMNYAKALLDAGVRIVDLSADFRIQDIPTWQQWYGQQHTAADIVTKAVYGLPELIDKKQIQNAQIIANPGCYATAMLLGLYPLLAQNIIAGERIIIDGKSGVSGAGKNALPHLMAAEVFENFQAYQVSGHRHVPEVTEVLQNTCKQKISITFVPHLLPMSRGILNTMYCKLEKNHTLDDAYTALAQCFANAYFVHLQEIHKSPSTKSVKGSNNCTIGISQQHEGEVIIFSAIDNLLKGAASQAIQNINIMFGDGEKWCEQTGIEQIGLAP